MSTIPKVTLGKTGQKVSHIGLGCMGMSEFYGKTDEEENLKTLNFALDHGVNFLDTADIYGIGDNEELLAKVLKTRRKDIFLCTKFGIVRSKTDPTVQGVCGKADYVKKACEASLKRLGVDYIDLYYLHRQDPQTPIEETVKAMGELVKEGKVKYIGLSEVNADVLRRAHAIHPITAVQSEYSLWCLEGEKEVIPTCKELGISYVAYAPLGRGFLTGQIKKPEDFAPDDYRRNSPQFQGENFKNNLDIVHKLEHIAKQKGCTPSQLALAWVLSQGDHVIPIPGTKRVKYLEENIGAVNVKVSAEEMKEINDLARHVKGERYPPGGWTLIPTPFGVH